MLTALFACTSNLFAQHQHSGNVIDGAEHPELIPDSVAYRLFFTTVSVRPNPTPNQVELQRAQLGMVGLDSADTRTVVTALATFRREFDALVARYNKAAGSEEPDSMLFDLQQDRLLANTRGALKATLSTKGMSRLDAYVQAEKKHMQLATGSAN
jgi:hypothetical protein